MYRVFIIMWGNNIKTNIVPGGVGIGGNINIGKNIYANNIIIGVSQLINGRHYCRLFVG